ncbi:MAG: hypothetical protein U1E10_06505 [Bdellovibrionales bacterium]|nr:hypothetical protein [Bdellovibrionales bacterium]
MKFKSMQIPGVLVFVLLCFIVPSPSWAQGEEASGGLRFTYDISASVGSVSSSSGDSSYTEIALGLNTFFSDWLVWRNSGFTRMGQGFDGTYGLDSSARFVLNVGDSTLGLNAFLGPGYRVILNQSSTATNQTDSAPFAEAGAVFRLGGLNLGGGMKSVFNSMVRSGAKDDVQYFLILSGGGTL